MHKFLVSILLCFIKVVSSTSHQVFSSKSNDKLYLFSNRFFSSGLNPVKIEVQKKHTSCIDTCNKMNEGQCSAISIVQQNSIYECKYFDNNTNVDINLEYSTNKTAFLVRKGQDICSDKCRILNIIKICGNCECRDSCGVGKNYQCDCTKAVAVFQNCQKIYDSGQQTTGKYMIDPDGNGSFSVICNVQLKEYINQRENRMIC
nr:uncharacterized protein LOC105847129 isoform X2 [Hydra vulgaris]